jgi:uncharacterized protein (TIGR02996 family)
MNHEAFLAAIRETPDDDAPRLIYADWLEDNGDEARAQFIRVQCRRAALPADDPEARRLARREKEILQQHGTAWTDTQPEVLGEWRRGFVEHLTIPAQLFIDSGAELVERFPVFSLRLRVDSEDVPTMRRLAAAPHLAHITHLSFERATPASASLNRSGEGLIELLGSPYLGGLRVLDLSRCWLGDDGVRRLAEANQLGSLERLELGYNYFSSSGLALLAASHLVGLRYLGLSGSRLGPSGAEVLVSSRHLGSLRELDLTHTRILTAGVQTLVGTDFLARLEVLQLGWLNLRVRAAQALAKCPHLANLRELILGRNRLADAGATALAGSPYLAGLRRLGLRSNRLTVAGITALGESKYLAGLERFDLGGNGITPMEREQLRARFGKKFGRF